MPVINLAERTDRWDAFQTAWAKTDLKVDRTDAIKDTDVYKAVFMKHRELIEEAHTRGEKYLLVMEDDAIPCADFDVRWKQVQDVLHSFEHWEIFNGGCLSMKDGIQQVFTLTDKQTLFKTILLSINRGCMAQFLYFNVEKARERMKTWEGELFDSWYCDKFQVLACVPFLAVQSDGFSNATGKEREWENRFQAEEAGLLHSLRDFLADEVVE
jgi:GR25 family glycosyltransferase involved in LPS biosynthesis